MKKIGILYGKEDTFPQAFIDRVNAKNIKGITAEAVQVDTVQQAAPTEYAVIIDRISQDVPFYRAYLKNAALSGTAVINNPFWWSADEKFFNSALAETIGAPVPKTVILPSHHRPDDTDAGSFRNLVFPTSWEDIFSYIGFPAYMKPHSGGGWKSVYRVTDQADLFKKHAETGQLVMMLQEEILFDTYFRCYCLGGDNVHVMQYEPRNPHHLRYVTDAPPVETKLMNEVVRLAKKVNQALGYDFNTIEFAVRDGIPYAIDFCNPAPDADIKSVGAENFEWIVENAANMAIARAKANKPGKMNLTWGTFVKDQLVAAPAKKPAAKKVVAAKKPAAAGTAKKAPAKKVVAAKKPTAAGTAKKPAAKKVVAAKKPAAKKVVAAKKPAAKKPVVAKAPAKKAAAKSAKKA